MSIFDPFDPARMEDGPTCICGRHRSQAEHDYQSRLMLQCVPVETDRRDRRFDGVVAAAALRTTVRRAPRRLSRRGRLQGGVRSRRTRLGEAASSVLASGQDH